jgi:Domain of unknown function (DUF4384)
MNFPSWLLLSFLVPGLLGGQEPDKKVDHHGAKEAFFGFENGPDEEVVISNPKGVPPKPLHKQHRNGSPTPLSLRYWIELRGTSGSEPGLVTESRVFKSGERIRFYFSSSTGGYISLAQRHTNGTLTLLFPRPDRGLDDTRIQPSVDRILPSQAAWFKFDDKPSTERIVIFFAESSKKLDTLIQTAVRAEMPEEAVVAQLGSKDIELEIEDTVPSQIGTYLVSRDGRAVIRNVLLKHD